MQENLPKTFESIGRFKLGSTKLIKIKIFNEWIYIISILKEIWGRI